MTCDEWLALAKRCAEVKGPDRDIDFAIDVALAAPATIKGFQAKAPYTASIDASTALIAEKLPGYEWKSGHATDRRWRGRFSCFIMHPDRTHPDRVGYAATEPAARCAAFCRAMAERMGQ